MGTTQLHRQKDPQLQHRHKDQLQHHQRQHQHLFDGDPTATLASPPSSRPGFVVYHTTNEKASGSFSTGVAL
jgi:hypothetical protein